MSSVINQPESLDTSLLCALVENSTAALMAVDGQGRCTFASPACEEVTGYQPHELLGQTMHDLLHHSYPDGRPYPGNECSLYKAMSVIQPIRNLEDVFFKKDGTPFHALCSSNPIVEDGVCKGAVVEIKDISYQKQAEEALRESEARFRSMADQAPILIAMSERDTDLVYFNKAWLDYTGRTLDEELAFGWSNGIHPEDREGTIQTYMEAHAIQAGFEVEYRLRRHDGEYRWMYSKVAPRTTLNGEFAGYIGVIIDVDDRIRTEQALKESEARFRTMADSAPLFVWISGPDGNINYVNKTWADFLHMSPEDVAAFGMREAMFPEDLEFHKKEYREAFGKREPFTIECRMRRGDGETRWLLNKGAPLFLPNGELAGYIGTSIDITLRKEAEDRLQIALEREQLIRRVVEITSQSFDIDFILKTVADEIGRYFGADRASVARYSMMNGEFIYNISAEFCREGCRQVDPEDTQLIMNAFRHLSPEALAANQEQIVNIPDQQQYLSYLEKELEKFPYDLPGLTWDKLVEIILKYNVQSSLRVNIFYRGVPYGSISMSQCTYNRVWTPEEVELVKIIADHAGSAIYQAELYRQAQETAVGEQRARQELEVYARRLELSNAELESFATMASHDLQAPLRKIQMFTDHLKKIAADSLSDEAFDDLTRIEKSAGRMQSLVLDLLTLSRVTRKGAPFQAIKLDEVLRNVIEDLHADLQTSGGSVQFNCPHAVDADRTQLQQLFQNLIQNSLKFRREDAPPRIEIRSREDGDHCEIRLQDNGIGFRQEYADKIFQIFQRLHGENTFAGTGIGLTICKKIVERHRGSIEATGTPGEGAIFVVRLPIRQQPE